MNAGHSLLITLFGISMGIIEMEHYRFERNKALNAMCIFLLVVYAFGMGFAIAAWGI